MTKVAIYCGHGTQTNGVFDGGASYGSESEAKRMLPITEAFVKYARLNGFEVITDVPKNNINMIKQVEKSNKAKVDVHIAIHCDWYKASSGSFGLYCKGSTKGKKLATALNKYVKEYTKIPSKGTTARTDLYELNKTNMPACVFECGSIKEDKTKWDEPHEADAYGKALARGLCDYYGRTFKETAEKKTSKPVYKTSQYAKDIKRGLKKLGYFDGKVDSYVTPEYTEAVIKFQKKAFKRASDIDGIGGSDTLKAVDTFVNFIGIKYFKPEEFRCKCGHCTGYPAVVDRQLLLNLEDMRKKNGPIKITSGLRCKWKNSRLSGSSSNSRHMRGKAVDIYNSKLTKTADKRRATIKLWYKYKKASYAYGNTPGMGNAIHIDVK